MGFCCASYEESSGEVIIELHVFCLGQNGPYLACLAIKIAVSGQGMLELRSMQGRRDQKHASETGNTVSDELDEVALMFRYRHGEICRSVGISLRRRTCSRSGSTLKPSSVAWMLLGWGRIPYWETFK
jgi:hypothetical protein